MRIDEVYGRHDVGTAMSRTRVVHAAKVEDEAAD